MIREIFENEIKDFIKFGDNLYKGDSNYVPFINSDLHKTIKKLVFIKKTYFAVCHFNNKGKIDGRILLHISKSKQLSSDKCGYFSHFEVVEDYTVFSELMEYSVNLLKSKGAEYFVGSFFCHDPDNRRGILTENFGLFPMIFTSYNKPYYKDFFERANFKKLADAVEYEYVENKETTERVKEIAEKALIENDIYIEKFNYKNIDRDVRDAQAAMEMASTQANFEYVLPAEEIKKLVLSWKMFINTDYVYIARKNSDNSLIGFTVAIPNYNEVIKKMKGKKNIFSLLTFVFARKKIMGLRAFLQYIIPEYQHKGVSKALYMQTKKAIDKNKVSRLALGTMMENNESSNGAMISIGGEKSKTYRLYYTECK